MIRQRIGALIEAVLLVGVVGVGLVLMISVLALTGMFASTR